jgi:hypothetical protein
MKEEFHTYRLPETGGIPCYTRPHREVPGTVRES